MRWAENVAPIIEIINSYKSVVGILEGERPLRRPRHNERILLKCSL
jgi:hypothetical protein